MDNAERRRDWERERKDKVYNKEQKEKSRCK